MSNISSMTEISINNLSIDEVNIILNSGKYISTIKIKSHFIRILFMLTIHNHMISDV